MELSSDTTAMMLFLYSLFFIDEDGNSVRDPCIDSAIMSVAHMLFKRHA